MTSGVERKSSTTDLRGRARGRGREELVSAGEAVKVLAL